MEDKYVTKLENGAYRITGTRVSLDSVVSAYKRGELPETIAQNFPFLNLAQVHGAIAFYLSNQAEIDEYLRQNENRYEQRRQESRAKNPEFYARFEKARQEMRQKALTKK